MYQEALLSQQAKMDWLAQVEVDLSYGMLAGRQSSPLGAYWKH